MGNFDTFDEFRRPFVEGRFPGTPRGVLDPSGDLRRFRNLGSSKVEGSSEGVQRGFSCPTKFPLMCALKCTFDAHRRRFAPSAVRQRILKKPQGAAHPGPAVGQTRSSRRPQPPARLQPAARQQRPGTPGVCRRPDPEQPEPLEHLSGATEGTFLGLVCLWPCSHSPVRPKGFSRLLAVAPPGAAGSSNN